MKQIAGLLLALALCVGIAEAQISTQDAFNKASYRVTAGTTSVNNAGYVVGVLVGRWIASDTLTVKNGAATTLARIIVDATPPEGPVWIPIGALVTTDTLTCSIVKTSDITLIYRTEAPNR